MDDIIIDEETIQTEAETLFEEKLNPDELEEVEREIRENLIPNIQDALNKVFERKENERIKSQQIYYRVLIKNPYSYHGIFKNFTELAVFETEQEAVGYISRQEKTSEIKNPYVEYKIEEVKGS